MVNNNWLPYEKYKIFNNTDKIEITLSKGLLFLHDFTEDTKLIITNDTLEIISIIDYHNYNNIIQKNQSWKIKISPKEYSLMREALKDTLLCLVFECFTDVAPAHIICYSNNKKIYSGQFRENSLNFNKFLQSTLKEPILRKKFNFYKCNNYYNNKKNSTIDKLPF